MHLKEMSNLEIGQMIVELHRDGGFPLMEEIARSLDIAERRGYRKGMERAAEICAKAPIGEWGVNDCIRAIRAEKAVEDR